MAVKKKTKTKINIKQLNNKSRKGTYIYIRIGNNRGQYYKYETGTTIDPYVQYYKDRNIKQKTDIKRVKTYVKAYEERIKGIKPKKRIRPHRQIDRYLQKIKRQPKLKQAIKGGITKVVIQDVRTASDKVIQIAKRKLLRPLVIDNQLLEIITTEENMKKLSNRFEYRLHFIDRNGNLLAEDSKISPEPTKMIKQLQTIITKEETIKKDKEYEGLRKKLQMLGYENWNYNKDGKVWRTQLTIIFRKKGE